MRIGCATQAAKFTLALAPAIVLASMAAFPAGPSLAATTQAMPAIDVAADPAAAWTRFLAEGSAPTAYDAFKIVGTLGYDGEAVDAAACDEHAAALADAIVAAPVGIALRQVALLCAEVLGDATAAASAEAALSALAQLALGAAGEPGLGRPIRILYLEDAYVLLEAAGLEARYSYFSRLLPQRHFPLVVVARNAADGTERAFEFDFLETAYELSVRDGSEPFPLLRQQVSDEWINGLASNGHLAAVDVAAMRTAYETATHAAKREALRTAVIEGGVQSTRGWIMLCLLGTEPDCGEGLVDSILPHAEAGWSMAMAHLAVAYAEGLGVERDQAAADALLQAAERVSRPGDARAEYLSLRLAGGRGEAASLSAAMRALAERGHPGATAEFAAREDDGGAAGWPEGLAERLAGSPFNDTGYGAWMLSRHHRRQGDAAAADQWLARAAELGTPGAQSERAFAMLAGEPAFSTPSSATVALMRDAAHGADAYAARWMADSARRTGRIPDAERWLLAAVREQSADAMIELSELVLDYPDAGLQVSREQAIALLRELAPQAPRAGLALAGRLFEDEGADLGIDADEVLALLRTSAEAGDADSMLLLGSAHLMGRMGAGDPASGRAWMDKALAAGAADAYAAYGSSLYNREGADAAARSEALAVWRKGEAAGDDMAANNLAWALCTSPHADVLDAGAGLEVSRALEARLTDAPPSIIDTFAACHAAAGEHARAVELQQGAIALLPRRADGQPDDRSGFGDRLALYRNGDRYVEQGRE